MKLVKINKNHYINPERVISVTEYPDNVAVVYDGINDNQSLWCISDFSLEETIKLLTQGEA